MQKECLEILVKFLNGEKMMVTLDSSLDYNVEEVRTQWLIDNGYLCVMPTGMQSYVGFIQLTGKGLKELIDNDLCELYRSIKIPYIKETILLDIKFFLKINNLPDIKHLEIDSEKMAKILRSYVPEKIIHIEETKDDCTEKVIVYWIDNPHYEKD